MTAVINLFLGPGGGKTTTSMCLAAAMKDAKVADLFGVKTPPGDIELVREAAKEFAWQKIPITKELQPVLCQTQIGREEMYLGRVDFIVTDSPVLISPFYEQKYFKSETCLEMALDYHQELIENGHVVFNFMLSRHKPFNPKGRYETEEQARQIDVELKAFLLQHKIPFTQIHSPTAEAVKEIINHIRGIK